MKVTGETIACIAGLLGIIAALFRPVKFFIGMGGRVKTLEDLVKETFVKMDEYKKDKDEEVKEGNKV